MKREMLFIHPSSFCIHPSFFILSILSILFIFRLRQTLRLTFKNS
jgi:hypothetical protein